MPIAFPSTRLLPRAAAILLALAGSAPAVDVSFDLQPRFLNLGETAQASLVFHGIRGMGGVDLPPVDGLSISPPSIIQQSINGAHSVRMDYRIFPQKAGRFTIGPYTLDIEGQPLRIPELQLEVRAPDGADASREMLFARLRLPDHSPYVHQVFDIVLHLYAQPGLELTQEINLGGFPENGLVLGPFEELQTVREEVDGQFYVLRRFRSRVRAVAPGTYSFQPSLRVGLVDRQAARQRRDPFGGFFGDPFSRPSATPVNIAAPPQSLSVRPIPPDGRPAAFDGAIGRFDFTVDVRPRELKVGEPLTVTLRLQGSGNIAAARPPAYRDSDAFKTYDPRLLGDAPEPHADHGTKTFEQVVIPRTPDLAELPALDFSFFDPDSGQYRTLSAGPFPLTVHASETGADALLLQIPGANGAAAKTLVLGSDIVYLQSPPARWLPSPERSRARLAALLALHAAAPLALAALFFASHRRNRLAADIALARRHKAPRSARAALRRAESAWRQHASPADVFDPLVVAAADYFGHRLNLPPGAVDPPLILDQLRKAATPEETLAQWQDFFALSEQIRYASNSDVSRETLAAWIATLTTLRKAERSRI